MSENFVIDGVRCRMDFVGDYRRIVAKSGGRTFIDLYDKDAPIEKAKWAFGVMLKKRSKL